MIITEKIIKNLLSSDALKSQEDITTVEMDSVNISSFHLKTNFCNIEYLSLQNNNISDINFLNHLPSIWYLDLRNNPIDSYEVLNFIKTIGFLGISTEKYSEKKIFSIRKMNIGIFNSKLEEEYRKTFLLNNPNIIKFNDEIMYYNFKNVQQNLNPFIKKFQLNDRNSQRNNNTDKNGSLIKTHLNSVLFQNIISKMDNNSNNKGTLSFENKKSIILKNFFENFNKEMRTLRENTFKSGTSLDSMYENSILLNLEKKKLMTLKNVYESIIVLHKDQNNLLYLESYSKMNSKVEHSKIAKKFLNLSILKVKEFSTQIIILVILVLHILQLVGKELAVSILKYILNTFSITFQIINSDDIKSIMEMDIDLLLGLYFEMYDQLRILFNKNSESKKVFNIDKLRFEDLIETLEMLNLILNANVLKTNRIEAFKIYDISKDLEKRKSYINVTLIKLIDEKIKNFDTVLKIVQYLSDYILHNKIDKILLKENLFQYRVFIEIKELMYNYLNRKSKDNNIYKTLVDRKYTDHVYKRLGNKLFFSKKPSEENKNENNLLNFLNITLSKNHTQKSIKDESKKFEIKPRRFIDRNTNYENFVAIHKDSKSQPVSKIEEKENYGSKKNIASYQNEFYSNGEYSTHYEIEKFFKSSSKITGTDNLNIIDINNSIQKINSLHNSNSPPMSNERNQIQDIKPKESFDYKTLKHKLNLNKKKGRLNINNKTIYDDDFHKLNNANEFYLNTKYQSLYLSTSNDELPSLIEPNCGTSRTKDNNIYPHNIVIDYNVIDKCHSKTNKIVYDFRFNIKKLTHHWNSNNKNVKVAKDNLQLRNINKGDEKAQL